ncbi:MAG: hypothetical protein O2857_07680 [Planctomycetota bacterium]|nr:hypothetical protein [Planctomycetota bacterium]
MSLLARIILLLEGEWTSFSTQVESVAWSFATGGHAILMVGAAAGLILAMLCYIRTTEGLTLKARTVLGALRLVSTICLVLIAAGAVTKIHLLVKTRPELLIVIDDSQSMHVRHGEETRFKAAMQFLLESTHIENLRRTFNTPSTNTSSTLGQSGQPQHSQNLAEAVVLAASVPQRRGPPDHILLVSDGIQVGLSPLSDAAAQIGVSVSVLSFGDGSGIKDAWIRSASIPPFVYHRDPVPLSADIRSTGLEGEALLKLFYLRGETEKEVASVQVTLNGDSSAVPARIEFTAEHAGLQHYELRLAGNEDELTPLNNTLRFHLDVRPEKMKVLFIEGQPSWEYRYIKRALSADPAVEFHGLVRLPPDEWFFQGKNTRKDGQPILKNPNLGFPDSIEELTYFDTIILGDLERKIFEQAGRFALLEEFVRMRAGGLATIGGLAVYGAGNFDGTPLARLVPFQIEREKKLHLVNRFNVQLTPQGIMHPIMRLDHDPAKNEMAWNNLPWVEGGNAIRRTKSGATALLVHPTLSTQFGPRPVSAVWRCGKGRVFSSALDGTWHWALARKTEIDFHRRFWGLNVRWLSGDPRTSSGNSVILETPICEVGEPVALSTTIRDDAGGTLTEAEVIFTIVAPDQTNLVSHLKSNPAQPGRFAMSFHPATSGMHKVVVSVRLPEGSEEKKELEFFVTPSRKEFLSVKPDERALRELAEATGGTVVPIRDQEKLKIPTPETQHSRVVELTVQLWQSPGLVLLLILCLSLEWLLRKRRGLA